MVPVVILITVVHNLAWDNGMCFSSQHGIKFVVTAKHGVWTWIGPWTSTMDWNMNWLSWLTRRPGSVLEPPISTATELFTSLFNTWAGPVVQSLNVVVYQEC
jgi:hypothetical protein